MSPFWVFHALVRFRSLAIYPFVLVAFGRNPQMTINPALHITKSAVAPKRLNSFSLPNDHEAAWNGNPAETSTPCPIIKSRGQFATTQMVTKRPRTKRKLSLFIISDTFHFAAGRLLVRIQPSGSSVMGVNCRAPLSKSSIVESSMSMF